MTVSINTMIVIPAYNEAGTIRQIVLECLQLNHKVIVVNDCSSDTTLQVLSDLPVHVLSNKTNSGKAASLWIGMQFALKEGADQIITLDGDGQHKPENIPLLLEKASKWPDHLIIAARLKDNDQAPKARLFANRFADFWVSWAAGQWVRDSQSGFRLYPARLIRNIQVDLDRNKGFVFESKVIIEASRLGINCKIVEISSVYHENLRPSHFRPVADIVQIVKMIAWSLISRGLFLPGLWRALKQKG